MAFYDEFEFGNTNVGSANVYLGKDNSGSLGVPPLYRLKTKFLDIYNNGSTAAVITLQKTNGTNTITILYKTLAAAGSQGDALIFDDKHPFIIETGYYLQANISVGSAAIFGQGEFVPE